LAAFVEEYDDSAAFTIAMICAWLGDNDQAFLWLDKAFEQRDSLLAEILLYTEMRTLISDPRWPAFLDKMGLPH
jgi:hypothetical protein